jgi:hypothetical protein
MGFKAFIGTLFGSAIGTILGLVVLGLKTESTKKPLKPCTCRCESPGREDKPPPWDDDGELTSHPTDGIPS